MKTTRTPKAKNSIIYSGPSMLDGQPIIVVAIVTSGNVKTGNMLQTHIIRADQSPMHASRRAQILAFVENASTGANPPITPPKRLQKGARVMSTLGKDQTKYSRLTPQESTPPPRHLSRSQHLAKGEWSGLAHTATPLQYHPAFGMHS